MSAILKIRIPFYERVVGNGSDGLATFYLASDPKYKPEIGQKVIITHTDVSPGSGLLTLLKSISTNAVLGKFQYPDSNNAAASVLTDGYTNFFTISYNDTRFSNFGAGNCTGYIEYDIAEAKSTYSVLKPIESAVIINESIPFDLQDGIANLTNMVSGATYPDYFLKGMLVKRQDTNTVFANLMKSLNLPVSSEEMKKYTRSPLGQLTETTSATPDVIKNNIKYNWTAWASYATTTEVLSVHPTTGWTGEYYGTALQTIGSYDFDKDNKAVTPVTNDAFLIFEIPNSKYGEIIDGKSVKFTLPYYTGTTIGAQGSIGAKLGIKTYGATISELSAYGTYNKSNLNLTLDRILSEKDLTAKDIGVRPDLTETSYESNIVFLFSDAIKIPQGSNLSSWSAGYSDLLDGTRVFNTNSIEKATYDNALDECVGFVALDKGFLVITHPVIVDSYLTKIFAGTIATGGTTTANAFKTYDINGTLSLATNRGHVKTDANKMIVTIDDSNNVIWDSTQFVFSGVTGSMSVSSDIEYISYNTEKSLNVICLASSDEFFKSTNDTAKEMLGVVANSDYVSFKDGTSVTTSGVTEYTSTLYPIIITQLGIHDAQGNLLAIAKPVQPIKKYWYDIVSFNLKIRL